MSFDVELKCILNEEKRQTGMHALQMYVKQKHYVALAAFVDSLLREIDWPEEAPETTVYSVRVQNARKHRNDGWMDV